MDWMRNVSTNEDFLLGKQIKDKKDNEDIDQKFTRDGIFDNFKHKSNEAENLVEDPLNLIHSKRKEYEKEILSNPIKLRKIQKSMSATSNLILSENRKAISDQEKLLNMKIACEWNKLKKVYTNFERVDLEDIYKQIFTSKSSNPTSTASTSKGKAHSFSEKSPHFSKQTYYKHRPRKSSEKIKEMQANAAWREEDRKFEVEKQLNRDNLVECKEKLHHDSKTNSFIKPMIKNITESTTINEVIKRKRNKHEENSR